MAAYWPRGAETVLLGENCGLYNLKLCCKIAFAFDIHLTTSKITRLSFQQSTAAAETDYVVCAYVMM